MGIGLYDYQLDAISKMKNGCILCGGVGSGKSRTSLAYYYISNGGELRPEGYFPMNDPPQNLYIITTARKRDTCEWEQELSHFLMSTDKEHNTYCNEIHIDSWNNIAKYAEVENAFFIFDEQRVIGKGAWVKSFIKIARHNNWILLSATPGDTWIDYIPVFIANGFYKNRTEFIREHVVYSYRTKFPKVDRYVNTGRLIRLRKSILIDMDYTKPTESHNIDISVEYDMAAYKQLMKERWNYKENKPIENASELCYEIRKIVNSDVSRLKAVETIMQEHPRVIIFYNYDYELDILKDYFDLEYEVAEWNGHKHQPLPEGESWLYLVQYTAGCEGWNCIKTDTIIFYSQNYSYKVMVQASGRIDRLNTPYKNLYYYHLKSKSSIDLAIAKALREKKKFNEMRFADS